jgi:sugar fermentation stimulation protein A
VKKLDIPWNIVKKESNDRGTYLILLRLHEDTTISVGGLGKIDFKAGYYIYVGKARRNLSRRIERHRRVRKRVFWHIDYLRNHCTFHVALPIRTYDDLECELTRSLKNLSDWAIPGFGSSDCRCKSHLLGMKHDPLRSGLFHSVLGYYRMERYYQGESSFRGSDMMLG